MTINTVTSGGPVDISTSQNQFVGDAVIVGGAVATGGEVGFFGTEPVTQAVVAAAASDAATTQALANSLRTILIAYGLVRAA